MLASYEMGSIFMTNAVDPAVIRAFLIRGLAIPLVFFISVAISFFSASAAIYSWLVLVVLDFLLLGVLRRHGENSH